MENEIDIIYSQKKNHNQLINNIKIYNSSYVNEFDTELDSFRY